MIKWKFGKTVELHGMNVTPRSPLTTHKSGVTLQWRSREGTTVTQCPRLASPIMWQIKIIHGTTGCNQKTASLLPSAWRRWVTWIPPWGNRQTCNNSYWGLKSYCQTLQIKRVSIIFPSLCGSGIWGPLGWMVWLRLSLRLLGNLLAWWLSFMAGKLVWLLWAHLPGAPYKVIWVSSWCNVWLPPEQAMQESNAEAVMSFMAYPLGTHIPSLA